MFVAFKLGDVQRHCSQSPNRTTGDLRTSRDLFFFLAGAGWYPSYYPSYFSNVVSVNLFHYICFVDSSYYIRIASWRRDISCHLQQELQRKSFFYQPESVANDFFFFSPSTLQDNFLRRSKASDATCPARRFCFYGAGRWDHSDSSWRLN